VELARVAADLQRDADVYIVNPDTPENSQKVLARTGLTIPILLDPQYSVAQRFDLRGQGRPMGGLVGYVIMDPAGIIRVQRVDIDFGRHAPRILEIVRRMRNP